MIELALGCERFLRLVIVQAPLLGLRSQLLGFLPSVRLVSLSQASKPFALPVVSVLAVFPLLPLVV